MTSGAVRRVLVAGDVADFRDIPEAELVHSGYEVEVARDGIEALDLARANPPDVIASELMMPRLDGFMLLRHWRRDDRLASIPFIAYTGVFTDPEHESLARSLGADDYLVKPATLTELLARIEAVLERPARGAPRGTAEHHGDQRTTQRDDRCRGEVPPAKRGLQLAEIRSVLGDKSNPYSSLFHNNHLPMLLIDPADSIIVEANSAAVTFYGWSHDELLTKSLDSINTLDRAEVRREMERASMERRTHFLFRHRRADGSERDVEVYRGPVIVGGFHLVYLIVSDVTERRRSERRLRRTENLLRAASSVAQVGGWEVNLTDNHVYWSDEVYRIIGAPRGMKLTLGGAVRQCAPEYRERLRTAFQACAQEGIAYDEEIQILRMDGSRVWVRMAGEAERDKQGRITGMHGALQNIEAQVAAQQELRQLQLAVEQSPESIVITDLEPRILYVNEAACRISGYSREELLGENPRILGSGKTPRETYAFLWQTLQSGRPWSGILHNRRKDGQEFVESATISPVRQKDGRITRYLSVKEDITEQRRTEHELKRYRFELEDLVRQRTQELAEAREQAELANRAKSMFLANMSHEIRTPLNGVLGTVDLLEAEELSHYQQELVGVVRESGRSLIRIIEDILDFSRIEAGRLTLECVEFSLEEVVEGLCESLAGTAYEKGVDLHVCLAPEVPVRLVADDVRLRQILYNLVGNAIKFSGGRSGKRGRVLLDVSRSPERDGELRFTVEDNGIGISEEAGRGLFKPFSQAEQTSARRYGGSGLGLAICKRLVDMSHGSLTFRSTVGTGTTFEVDLPLEAAPRQPATDEGELFGVRCAVIRHPSFHVDAVSRYLVWAGAETRVLEEDDPLPRGWAPHVEIRYRDDPVEELADGPGASDVARVHLSREAATRPRRLQDNVIVLGSSAIRRRALLDSMLLALNRESTVSSGIRQSRFPVKGQPPAVEDARRRGELILVVEDDEIGRKVIGRQLHLLGYAAEIAHDGEEALKMWRQGGHGLVLTDLHMPRMDGYELTAAIRREEAAAATGHAPVIALTANALRGEAARAKQHGLDDYLTKPLQIEQLAMALGRWLKRAAKSSGDSVVAPDAAGMTPDARVEALPVFDRRALESYVGADEEFQKEFLQEYLVSAAGLLDDVRRACDASDLRQVSSVAHKLKSSSRAVGALMLGDLAEKLEGRAKAGAMDAAYTSAGELQQVFGRFQTEIDEYLQSMEAL